MSARTLVPATLIAILLTAGIFFVGSKLSFGKQPLDETVQRNFRERAINTLNIGRQAQNMSTLSEDPQIQRWLDKKVAVLTGGGTAIDPNQLLDALPEEVTTLSRAAVRTLTAKKTEDLRKQIEFWADGFQPQISSLAVRLYHAERGQLGCVLVAADKAPEFSLDLLNEGVTEFYNVCRHCNEPHLGTLSKVNLALAIGCPHCQKTYDLLASDMMGQYHRANAFLQGTRPPPGTGSDAESRLEEMVALWDATVSHCRYAKDLSGLSGEKDSWQRPSETFTFRNGDCEDTSLLLVDWLISRGFNARLAIGDAIKQGGHAWVVVQLEGRQYLLETTIAEVPQTPPETALVADRYRPQYLFDRQNLYFLKGGLADISDYFTSDLWEGLAYPASSTPTATPIAGAPGQP